MKYIDYKETLRHNGINLKVACKACGRVLEADSSFCPKCGRNLKPLPIFIAKERLFELLSAQGNQDLLNKALAEQKEIKDDRVSIPDLIISGDVATTGDVSKGDTKTGQEWREGWSLISFADAAKKINCPGHRDSSDGCEHCSPKGACKCTVLLSSPPQYNMCPYRGSGYILCRDAE